MSWQYRQSRRPFRTERLDVLLGECSIERPVLHPDQSSSAAAVGSERSELLQPRVPLHSELDRINERGGPFYGRRVPDCSLIAIAFGEYALISLSSKLISLFGIRAHLRGDLNRLLAPALVYRF